MLPVVVPTRPACKKDGSAWLGRCQTLQGGPRREIRMPERPSLLGTPVALAPRLHWAGGGGTEVPTSWQRRRQNIELATCLCILQPSYQSAHLCACNSTAAAKLSEKLGHSSSVREPRRCGRAIESHVPLGQRDRACEDQLFRTAQQQVGSTRFSGSVIQWFSHPDT